MASERILDTGKLYKPLPQQMKFHLSGAKYRLYGGAAGGGKTIALIWEGIKRCLKYDFPVTGAIFRRSYPELETTIIRTTLEMLPKWFYKYNRQQHILTLKTGDRIEYGYAETDNDVTRYQSREWDWLGIDELTHFSEYRFTYLMSRVRTTKALKPKFFAATNPGGIGHAWVKSRWIDKSCEEPGYNSSEYDFVQAKVTDNTYLMEANPDYVNNLKMLPENEQKALLHGDWDVFEGQFFNEWDQSKHVCKTFEIPSGWRLILGWDDGTRAPRSVHLYAVDNDKRVWVIWEYYRKDESVVDAARNIRDELKEAHYWDRIFKMVVDPSMESRSTQTGISSREVLDKMGFGFKVGEIELGNNDRAEGWRLVKSYLSHKPYEEPLLKISEICPNMIRTLPQLIYYEKKSGQAKKDDLDCFVAGTKVTTLYGNKNVEDIKLGDWVLTPVGYRKVIKDGIGGLSKRNAFVKLSNGKQLIGTKDHKVFVRGRGLTELQDLRVGDILEGKNIRLWKLNLLHTRTYYIVGIPIVGIIRLVEVIYLRVFKGFIGKFISTIMAGFQRVSRYIIEMATMIITPQRTLNLLKRESTVNYTLRKDMKVFRRNSGSGEPVRKAKRRLKIMRERCLKEPRSEGSRAYIVEALLERNRQLRSFVTRNVNIGIGFLNKRLGRVPFVGGIFRRLINMYKPVHIIAVGNLEEEKIVYNLTVEDAHLYYANDVLVTNTSQEDHCADNLRYVLMSLGEMPGRFQYSSTIKPVTRSYKPKSILDNI